LSIGSKAGTSTGKTYIGKTVRGFKTRMEEHMRLYDTKEKAEEALNKYNETHEFLESDIKTRKKGTGTIKKSRNGKRFNAQIAINKTYFYNTFDTEEQCKEWVESLKNSV
jgi:hypothetical protein